MYGSKVGARPMTNATGTPSVSATALAARSGRTAEDQHLQTFPFFLVALVLLYVVYAFVEQHEKIKSAVRPENIAVNLRNIVVMVLTVVLGINVAKIASAKLVVWLGDTPFIGPAVRFFAKLMGGV